MVRCAVVLESVSLTAWAWPLRPSVRSRVCDSVSSLGLAL